MCCFSSAGVHFLFTLEVCTIFWWDSTPLQNKTNTSGLSAIFNWKSLTGFLFCQSGSWKWRCLSCLWNIKLIKNMLALIDQHYFLPSSDKRTCFITLSELSPLWSMWFYGTAQSQNLNPWPQEWAYDLIWKIGFTLMGIWLPSRDK